jgi:hypothetical protein
MRKMPCLFVRDFSTRPFKITTEVTPEALWVFQESEWKAYVKRVREA